jgi:cation:H+ antiporter
VSADLVPPEIIALALFAAGIALVVAGAEAFVDGLLATARRYQLSAFFLTIVVSGLEIENIVGGLAANLAGFPGAAAGTFLGGTSFVALAIAGLGAVIAPLRATLPRQFLLVTGASGLPLALLARDRELSQLDGALLIAWFALGMALLFRSTSGQFLTADDEGEAKRFPLLWLGAGLAVMSAGGELLGSGIQAIVVRFGLSPTLIGNTAIAALTEAEELGRVAVPTRRGRPDVAVANIGGTAFHFLSLNAGLIALVRPLPLDDVTMRIHLPVAVAAPLLFALIFGLRGGLGRAAGAILIALYVAYVAIAIAQAAGIAA